MHASGPFVASLYSYVLIFVGLIKEVKIEWKWYCEGITYLKINNVKFC